MFPSTLLSVGLLLLWVGGVNAWTHVQNNDGFSRFYVEFQNAVKASDKETVAGTIKFDHFDWEASDALRAIKTKEAFLKNYERMFTPVIKSKIATGKPIKTDEGYFIMWHTKDLEYSLYFFREKDGSYSFLGLTVGPR
jgi:predicted GH43/DUF377 family glycosyl hydrolase